MYFRRTTRRVGGTTYHNYLLVESVATPKGPRQRVICSLGTLAPGPKEAWLGTAQRLHAALAGQTALVRDATVEALAARARAPRARASPAGARPHDRPRPGDVRGRTGSGARARGPSDVAPAAPGYDPRGGRVESAGAAPDGSDDAEPPGAARLGARHARLDPAHGAGRHPRHGLRHARRRCAVSQPRSPAPPAGRDRAGAGRPGAHALHPGRRHLPLRPDLDVLRRAVPA